MSNVLVHQNTLSLSFPRVALVSLTWDCRRVPSFLLLLDVQAFSHDDLMSKRCESPPSPALTRRIPYSFPATARQRSRMRHCCPGEAEINLQPF